jgi:PrcB C-terminal
MTTKCLRVSETSWALRTKNKEQKNRARGRQRAEHRTARTELANKASHESASNGTRNKGCRFFSFVLSSSFFVLSCFLAAACTASPSAPDSRNDPLSFVRLRPEPLSLTYYSGVRRPLRAVVRDSASWQQTWAEIWQGHSPVPALPSVDFQREMVIVVALGEKPTGGYSILLDGVLDSASGLTVQVRIVAPGARCGTTLALTQPVDVARVTRRDGQVNYAERAETQDCP